MKQLSPIYLPPKQIRNPWMRNYWSTLMSSRQNPEPTESSRNATKLHQFQPLRKLTRRSHLTIPTVHRMINPLIFGLYQLPCPLNSTLQSLQHHNFVNSMPPCYPISQIRKNSSHIFNNSAPSRRVSRIWKDRSLRRTERLVDLDSICLLWRLEEKLAVAETLRRLCP